MPSRSQAPTDATAPPSLPPLAPGNWLPWVRASAGVTAAIALLALIGWFAEIRVLASFGSRLTPMPINAAVALLLLAFSLWSKTLPWPSPVRVLGRIAAVPVVVAGVGSLLQAMLGRDLGFVVWVPDPNPFPDVQLGRMSPITGVAMLPAAMSLLPPRTAIQRLLDVAAMLAVLPLLIGFAAVLGHLYGIPLLDRSTQIPLALNTGLALLVFAGGVLVGLGPGSRPVAPFTGRSVRARLLRAFIPLVVGTVLLQAVFVNVALGLSPASFALVSTVSALLVLVVFGGVASSVARRIARAIEAAESARHRSRAQLGALLEQLPDFVAVLHEDRIAHVNPSMARALGSDASALIGRPLLSLVHPDDREQVAERMPELAAGNVHPSIREQRWQCADGAELTVEVGARRTDFDDSEAVLLVARDITERRKLEEQLRQAVKMEAVGQLAGGVAHDFNNLLTAIISFSRFVREDLGPEHPSQPDISEVLGSAERAAALTRQLLAFSRKQVFDPRPIDVNEVLGRMEKMLRRVLGEDIDLVTLKGRGTGLVRSDPSHIEQILLNLAVNARDAMPGGGKLTIETSAAELDEAHARVGVKQGAYVLIAVTDTGQGMDEETQARIFEPFFTTKATGQGTGLGLSTIYGIVRQAGGDVLVYSAPGRGTTFKVYLPRAEGDAEVERPQAPASAPTGSETVLVVEDDAAVRAASLRALRAAGYRVLEAATPSEALALAQVEQQPIDLLLTDVVLPEMNGRELAERIAALRPGLRVLHMSGFPGGALLHQGLFTSGAGYLQKPFTPDSLARRVRDVLDGRAASPDAAGALERQES